MILFFLVFFSVYSAINYYLLSRGWQALQGFPVIRIVYLVVFLIAALSYIAARVFSKVLPMTIYEILTWVGSVWFAYMLYIFLFVVIFDLLRLGNHFFNFYPEYVKQNYTQLKNYIFLGVFIISTFIIFAGYLNTRNIKVTSMNIDVPAKSTSLDKLKIVMLSDIHLSAVNDKNFLRSITEKVNSQNPDLILIPGDIVDDKADYLRTRMNGTAFRDMKSKYGIYATMGNHEFINGGAESEQYIRQHGIKLLRDEAVLVENAFYLAGRDDSSKPGFTGKKRKTLKEITETIDGNYPVILMDHTPFKLEEASFHNIDLQLSGHTHHGQLFPLNFITNMVYEVSRGYAKKNNTHYYVSSGAGTWGPPVRTGSSSEIAVINLNFKTY